MTRARVVVLLAGFFASSAPGEPPQGQSPPAVLTARTGAYSGQRAVVVLTTGRDAGVEVGDQFWVFADGGETNQLGVAAWGEVYFVADDRSAGRLSRPVSKLSAGRPAAVLRQQALAKLADLLPPGVTVRGLISRVPPGARTAWLDLGHRAGLKPADGILIRRDIRGKQIPIARGRVELLDGEMALTTLCPLVGNALPQADDSAELWPEPAQGRRRRVNSAVLAVEPGEEGALVTIVGTAADGLARGRLVDLYRAREYVGVASITRTSDPLSAARMIESASADTPAVGDLALVRSGPGPPLALLSAAVFRIEGSYCLIAAGETDGVQVGDKFVVRRQDPADATVWTAIAELTVTTVKVDYAGADVRLLDPDGARLVQWDVAERHSPGLPLLPCRPIGIVERARLASRSAVVSIDPAAGVGAGGVLRWVPEGDRPPGAAIIVHRAGDQVILYVPPGWGELAGLTRARVELTDGSQASPPVTTRRAPDTPAGPTVPQ